MVNLLHAGLTRRELREIIATKPSRPLLPPLGAPSWEDAWRKPLLAPFVKEILRRADEETAAPLPELTDDLYATFLAHGTRLPFERAYFSRRRQLARAAVALLIENSPRRAEAFIAKLRGVFSEESWALPAHVKTPTGKDPATIDLFAAETANLMGECLNVFSALIPADLASAIRRRLREQIFDRYLQEPPFWWTTATSNWNAVCHQGVLGAALAIEDDPDLLADMLLKAAAALPAFLSGYGEDGACGEGPGYWVYGFGWFSVLNEQLETRTDGALSLFHGDAKIERIAAYGPAAVLLNHRVVNFSDCAQTIVLRPPLLAYLGRRLDLAECRAQAEENYAKQSAEPFDYEGQRVDLFHWLRYFLACPDTPAPAPTATLKADRFFPDLAVWIARGRDDRGHIWEVAAKAGHNDEHHNHNDVGSVILNIDGIPFLTEIGAPEYVRDFFGPDRYRFLAARSLGHSLPLVNNHEQSAGAGRHAKISQSEIHSDRVTFSADIATAYPAEAGCRMAQRTVEFDKSAGALRCSDRLALNWIHAPTESAFITHAEDVTIESPRIAVICNEGLTLELRANAGTRWVRIETHPYKGHEGQDRSIRRLVLVPEAPSRELLLAVEFRLRR